MVLREKELKRNKDRIVIVRSTASEKIIVKPGERKEIKGFIDQIVDHPTHSHNTRIRDTYIARVY